MDTGDRHERPHRPRPLNLRAKALLWTAVVSVVALDDLLGRLAI
ncbi:hypothetical protein [Streptomonospora litoralis]|uniref:Uncharacterized protein n=1 Tax=Streptomonospora litoralis TaxID=2498135 RepID=A0A4P6Q3L8_9ACTN|nr:hypothetical protein [Streptomonospora litoralis]QBI53861.1 hypothetical protein EKD16_10375 [Streptomonospora litoralis]